MDAALWRGGRLGFGAQCLYKHGSAFQVGCADRTVEKVFLKLCPRVLVQLTKKVALDSLFANCLVMIHRRNIPTFG